MNKRQPNYLMIMTDQHRADYLGCYGNPVVKTPNIDAIANAGTRFGNFNVASPVCMPNRASIFTGRYPSVHGLHHNGQVLPRSAVTFVDVLRDAGYETALIGKSHLQPMTDALQTEARNLQTNQSLPEARHEDGHRYDLEQDEHYQAQNRFDFPTPYYGFDHVRMVTKHGDQCGGHYEQWLRQKSPDADWLRDRSNQLPHDYICPQAVRTPIPEDLYPTSYIRDEAVEYLRGRSNATPTTPFFACVSFPDPHHPFTPPGKYWDMYSPDQFDVPLPYEAHKNPPPHLRACKSQLDDGSRITGTQKLFMATDPELREAKALTAGMITMIDDAVGTMMSTLKECGLDDNTVVIFNSDHGDYLGDFSMLLKGPISLRSLNRVAFIWSDPASRNPGVSDTLSSSVDIAPTIIERSGLLPYYGIQGKSLIPVIDNPATSLRSSVLIEHEDSQPKPGFPERSNLRTLLTERYRLTVYQGCDWGELYDLSTDPQETHNLWDHAATAPAKAELMHELASQLIEASDPAPWPNALA